MRISALSSAVPKTALSLDEKTFPFSQPEMDSVCKMTGIRAMRRAADGICASDLCVAAAREIFRAFDPETCDFLLFVTQTPDLLTPATVCIMQDRLGLRDNVLAIDVNKGCSGFTDGLLLAYSLIKGLKLRRGLLLVGDTCSKILDPSDRQTMLLFGDAGSAVWLEATDCDEVKAFLFGTDGSGADHLGQRLGYRYGLSAGIKGNGPLSASDPFMRMDGAEVFIFTLQRVPPLLHEVMAKAGWSYEDIDAFILHQANLFIHQNIAKKMKHSLEKYPLTLERFGNTTIASIPLTMTLQGREYFQQPRKMILAGYGIGLAWSALAVEARRIEIFPLVEL
jgi:3-oxoacyl-[acyl-carrier-protein] synthase-3